MADEILVAARKLRSTYKDPEEFKAVARKVLDEHGNGAAAFDKIAPEYQPTVLIVLRARLEVRIEADENIVDKDPAKTPKDRQGGKYVRDNWVWVVGTERFYRLGDSLAWSVKQFDSYYNNLAQRGSYSGQLFGNDTIRKVARTEFAPGRPIFIDGGNAFNLWRPSRIKPKEGDTTIWNEHLAYLYPNEADRTRVRNWMAWGYRNMHLKPNTALLLVGKHTGTGKSFIAQVLEQLVGEANTQRPKNSSIKGDFNSWLAQCKLCVIEELMMVGRRDALNNLKDTITEKTVEVNIKNIAAHKVSNFSMIMAITNHENAAPIDTFDSRWEVIGTDAVKAPRAYYERLWTILTGRDKDRLLSAIAHELLTCDIGDYDGLHRTGYQSTAKRAMIDASEPAVTRWLREEHRLGNYPFNLKLVSIRHDILAGTAIPDDVRREPRHGKSLETLALEFIRDELHGNNFDDAAHRTETGQDRSKRTLWGINGGETEYAKWEIGERARAYRSGREAARRGVKPSPSPLEKARAPFERKMDSPFADEREIDPLTGEPVSLH
jgi:hypothetical protein